MKCEATAGDYYDVIPLSGDRIALVIADVSGHGLGPSLLMSGCRSALRALSLVDLQPQDVVTRLEELLTEDLAMGQFITLVFGILNGDGSFTYSNAGHGPTLAVIDGQVATLISHRVPLGLRIPVPADRPLQSTLNLSPGDRIFLASDGTSEAQDPRGEMFGDDEVARIAGDLDLPCETVVERLMVAVRDHIGPGQATDDVTILCADRIATPRDDQPLP